MNRNSLSALTAKINAERVGSLPNLQDDGKKFYEACVLSGMEWEKFNC